MKYLAVALAFASLTACAQNRLVFYQDMQRKGCQIQSSVQRPAQMAYNPVTGSMWVAPGSQQDCYQCPVAPPQSPAWRPDGPTYLVCR